MSLGRHARRVAAWWFRPRAFERSGRLYRWLGVPAVRWALTATLGRLPGLANYRLERRGRGGWKRSSGGRG